MGLYANLPALATGVISLIVISVGAVLILAFNQRPDVQRTVRIAWIVGVVFIFASAAIFWLASAMVEGPPRSVVDRSLQKQQQDELRERVGRGGH